MSGIRFFWSLNTMLLINSSKLKTKFIIYPFMGLFFIGCSTMPLSKAEQTSTLRTQIAIEYIKNGDVNSAKNSLDEAIQIDPRNANAYMMLGVTYQLDATPSNLIQAEKYFKKAVSIDPDNPQIRNNYGQYLFLMGKYKEAINEFSFAANKIGYDNRDSAFTNLGYSYYKLNNLEQSISSFTTALRMNPKNSDALLGLSETYYSVGKINESQSLYKDYTKIVPVSNRNAKALWLGIRLTHLNDDSQNMMNMINILATKYPNSYEYKSYKKQSSRQDIAWGE